MKYRLVLGLILAMIFTVACGPKAVETVTPPTDPTTTRITITHELEVLLDPVEAGNYLLNPKPLEQGDYVSGRTVIIDILPKEGWKVSEWVGPVHDVSGKTEQVTMDSHKTVIIRMERSRAEAGSPGSGQAAGRPVFIKSIDALFEYNDGGRGSAVFFVEIRDDSGSPVAGASVSGVLETSSGVKSASAVTGADGRAKITEPWGGDSGITFDVTVITGAGLLYTPSLNAVAQSASPAWASFHIASYRSWVGPRQPPSQSGNGVFNQKCPIRIIGRWF